MTCWEMLGISPTNDKSKIRHAFAEKSKTCHPEDDPAAFSRLQSAYREALSLGSRNISAQSGHSPPLNAASAPAAAPSSAVVIQFSDPLNKSKANASGKMVKKASSPGFEMNFNELEKYIAITDEWQRNKITEVFGQLRMLCLNSPPKESTHNWKNFFTSQEFLQVCKNPVFTWQALDLLMRQVDFPTGVVQNVLTPSVQEWQYLWNGTPMWNRFEQLLNQWNKRDDVKKQSRSSKTAIITLSVIALFLLIAGGVGLLSKQNTKPRLPAVQSQNQTQAPAFNPQNTSEIDIASLGITADDLSSINTENKLRTAVGYFIEHDIGWDEAKAVAETLGIKKEGYLEMRQQYSQGDEKSALNMLEEYRPAEFKIISAKIHPPIINDIEGAEGAAILAISARKLLGINTADYSYLQEGYTRHGHNWLTTELNRWNIIVHSIYFEE